MEAHFTKFKEILTRFNNITDFSKVPIQISFDATAVTGRFQTRKSSRSEDEERIIYGLSSPDPLQKTLINITRPRDDEARLIQNKSSICINGMENTLDLIEEGAISRAKSYMAMVALALIPGSRPYCVGMYSVAKGSDSNALFTAHRQVVSIATKSGLNVVTLPGDGDVTLRSIQWGFFTCKRYNWFTELTIPLHLFYDSNGERPMFSLQDPLHVLKKLRNNVKRLETRCLALGYDKRKEKQFTVRWDLIYTFFKFHPEVMLHASISAMNLTDKQDPSLVMDISRLYEFLITYEYTSLGLYFKATHYIAEAYLDKQLDPYQRVYKVWWAKTFFVTWHDNVSYKGQFITDQTYKDMICACDALILYITLLIRKFPDAVITTEILGSDQNEQLFAFIRVSYAGGRSRNIDAAKMAFGIEKKNVRSELSLPEDTSVVAHTRGRTLMRPVVPCPMATSSSTPAVEVNAVEEATVWTAKMMNIGQLMTTMNKASEDCIKEGKQHKLPVFLQELDPQERTGRRVQNGINNEEDDSDDEAVDNEEEIPPVEFEDDGDTDSKKISTKLYGPLNLRTAEVLLLNGGRSTLSTTSRISRFEGDSFGISSDSRTYFQQDCGCTGKSHIKIGDVRTLPEFVAKNMDPKNIKGEIRFISYKSCPLTFFCPKHSSIAGSPNIWLHRNNKYFRCRLN